MGALSVIFGLLRGALPVVGGFFTGGFTWIWAAFSSFAGTALGEKVVIGAACLIGGFIWGFSHEHAVKERAVEAAVEAQNAEWQKKIAEANAKVEQRIQQAINAAKTVVPVSANISPDDLIKLCKNDESCRKAVENSSNSTYKPPSCPTGRPHSSKKT